VGSREQPSMSVFILASIFSVAASLPAAAQEIHTFNILSADPPSAIRTFGAQAHIQILASADELKGKQFNPVIGRISTEEALNDLLAGSGLEHRYVGDRAVALTSDGPDKGAISPGSPGDVTSSVGASVGSSMDAKSAERSPDALEEIVVTASKRDEKIQSVAGSIVALSGQDLAKRGVVDLRDLATAVPGINLSSYEPDHANISIRGVTTSSPSPTVAFYVDDVPVSSRNIQASGQAEPPLFDTQRVEVLKGPQGTLYGASAMGGAIKFVSNPADPNQEEFLTTAGVGTTQGGAISYEGSQVVNLPLVPSVLAVRIGAAYSQQGGFVDRVPNGAATLTGFPDSLIQSFNSQAQDNVNTYKTVGLRASLAYTPNDSFSARLDTYYQERHSADTGEFWPNLPRFEESNVVAEPSRTRLALPVLTLKYNLGPVDLTSITGYVSRASWLTLDSTFVLGSIVPAFALLPSPNSIDIQTSSLTQELRLSNSNPDARLKFVTGIYLQRENYADQQEVLTLGSGAGLPGMPVDATDTGSEDTLTKQGALFGEATVAVTDKLDATLGGRLYRIAQSDEQGGNGFFNGGMTASSSRDSETGFDPKLEVSYKFTSDNLVYVLADKGFRPGGGNQTIPASECAADLATLGLSTAPTTYKSDSLWNYEIGSKNTVGDGRAIINASAFYIDWQNIQQTVVLPTCGFRYFTNVGAAAVKGGELEIRVAPLHGLLIGASGTYSNAYITKATPSTEGAVGDPVQDAPKFVGNANVEYQFPLIRNGSGFARADYQWHGSQTSQFTRTTISDADPYTAAPYGGIRTITDPAYLQTSYKQLNFSVGVVYRSWTSRLYCDNVSNSHPLLAVGDDPTSAYTLRPRTIGITFSNQF
jgi:iron complex outermembrane recepter protein